MGAAIAHERRRADWLRVLHRWHWISAALSLAGMLVFAATGITLNHAGAIEARPEVATRTATLGGAALDAARAAAEAHDGKDAPLPREVRDWLRAEWGLRVGTRDAEWSGGEAYLSLPRPGGDAWLSLDAATGALEYERTDRGAIAFLNDLHKGRNTGVAWRWFLDAFALACLVFCITGLCLLQIHGGKRRGTWPVVGLGLLLPVLVVVLLMH
jgi:hypothetical protein